MRYQKYVRNHLVHRNIAVNPFMTFLCYASLILLVISCNEDSDIASGAGAPPETPKTEVPPPPSESDMEKDGWIPLKAEAPAGAVAAASTRRQELDEVPSDKIGTTLGINVLVDYEIMLAEANMVMSSGGSADDLYKQIVEIRRRYTNVFIAHGKKREDNGKAHTGDTDKYVNHHKEVIPIAKTQWIDVEIEKYRETHQKLATELNFLPYLINYSNYESLKRFDGDRAKSLGIQ